MRLRAIFVLATVSAFLFGACGPSFTSTGGATTGGSSSGGASGRDSSAGGLGAGAGGRAGAAGDSESDSGSAGDSEAGAGGSACSNPGTDKCVECLMASDCPAQTTSCKVDVCKVATHTCGTTNRALGTACKDDGGTVCDGAGACVSTHCTDGVQDADETDVDCGGSCGAKCSDTGPQQKCKINSDCVNGNCSGSPLLCQPPPACAASCAASCESCSVPGHLGSCAKLPPGVDDPANFCFMQAVCDVDGACVAAQNKGHFGDACSQDSDCFSNSCGAGLCKLRNGDACAEDDACKSARCSADACAACVGDADCASGKCNAGTCLLPGGHLCAAAADCASQQCFNSKTCAPTGSEACSTQACITHFCKNALCQTCSGSSDCPNGSACTGGSCLAPPGAYCTKNETCASGTCAPAALLSMRKCQ
jgi:hypothetical protein